MHNHLDERSLHLNRGYNGSGMNLIVCIAFLFRTNRFNSIQLKMYGAGRCGMAWQTSLHSVFFFHSHPVQYDWFIITSRWFHFHFQLKLQKYFHYYDLLMVANNNTRLCSHFNFSPSISLHFIKYQQPFLPFSVFFFQLFIFS